MTYQVAHQTRDQIEMGVLMSLGARGLMSDETTLYFTAKPRHRLVMVAVELTPADTYTITVTNKKSGKVLHEAVDVYVDMLNRTLLDLESNESV